MSLIEIIIQNLQSEGSRDEERSHLLYCTDGCVSMETGSCFSFKVLRWFSVWCNMLQICHPLNSVSNLSLFHTETPRELSYPSSNTRKDLSARVKIVVSGLQIVVCRLPLVVHKRNTELNVQTAYQVQCLGIFHLFSFNAVYLFTFRHFRCISLFSTICI